MRIIRLQAEGFKRLVAVDISPDGDLIEVRGDNGNGKSSVLDAIFAALGGAGAAPEKPVRDGEEAAVIRLDLGELVVTRYFTAAGTTALKVTNQDGTATYSSGQTMLDKLVGHIAFDPLEFLGLKPAEQAEELRKLVDIADPETGEILDLSAIEAERKRFYDERRDVNRDGAQLKARIEGLGGVRYVPDDAPDREAIVAALASAGEENSAIDAEQRFRDEKARELSGLDADLNNMRAELVELQRRIDEGAAILEDGRKLLAEAEPLKAKVDVEDLTAQLKTADNIAENVRANAERERMMTEFDGLKKKSGDLTAAMESLSKKRATAIASAQMPVDGLALEVGEDGSLGVLFDGVPFSQASDAQRLRVSAAVAMAANPELRVLRLKNGSLLDKAAIQTLRDMATANDFQIWAEFVGDEGAGIVMEAGEVRGAEKPEPLPKPRQRKKAEGDDATETEKATDLSTGEQASDAPWPQDKPVSRETRPADMPADGLFATAQGEQPALTQRPKAMREFTTKPRGE